ncbi:ABC transporter ATP-binding protein, partial [Aliivibrio sifiae]
VDNTVMTSWIFEGEGQIEEFVGGYHDAQRQRANVQATRDAMAPKVKEKAEPVAAKTEKVEQVAKPKKLSYKLQRELEQLPETLEKLENEITELQEKVNDASFFQQDPKKTDEVLGRLAEAEQELEVAFERWEELEALQ